MLNMADSQGCTDKIVVRLEKDVHRIRKNVQTLSSNHSTMYNKLKGYCKESAQFKNTQIKYRVDQIYNFFTLMKEFCD